jgi:Rtf2 RING-finger
VRPGGDAPFQCPLTGQPLNGRPNAFLHRPTGLLLSEKGLKCAPKMAREAIAEAAAAALAEGGGKGDVAALEAAVASGGAWEERDLVVINPEGQYAEDAKDRVMFIAQKVRRRAHLCRAQRASEHFPRSACRQACTVAPPRACKAVQNKPQNHDGDAADD